MSRYAISDIHGCAKTFRYLVEQRLNLQTTDHLYLLGDYIDRGPDSKGVIDFILELRDAGFAVTTLMGNHELMLLQALDEPEQASESWLFNGGLATLKSFNWKQASEITEKYMAFLSQLELYKELDDFLLVHAGFNFKAASPFQDFEAMLWIRHFEPDEKFTKGRRIIHGHTPTISSKIHFSCQPPQPPVINIDGGCVFTQRVMHGKLVALNLDTLEVTMEDNRDMLS